MRHTLVLVYVRVDRQFLSRRQIYEAFPERGRTGIGARRSEREGSERTAAAPGTDLGFEQSDDIGSFGKLARWGGQTLMFVGRKKLGIEDAGLYPPDVGNLRREQNAQAQFLVR